MAVSFTFLLLNPNFFVFELLVNLFEALNGAFCVALKIEALRFVVKFSDGLVFRVHQVALQNLLHDSCSLESGHVANYVTTHKGKLFACDKLVEAGEHQVGIRNQRVALEVFKVGQDERLLLLLQHKHEIRITVTSINIAALWHWKQKHRRGLSVLHQLIVLAD